MSDVTGSDTDKGAGTAGEPDEAALAAMSQQELLELGGKLDGTDTVFKDPRWPAEGTKAEKRAERSVALWLLLGGFFGLALLLIFLFWPWEYKPTEADGSFAYSLATPLYGFTFGMSVLSIAIGAVLFQKKFIPKSFRFSSAMTASRASSTARPWWRTWATRTRVRRSGAAS